MKGVEMVGDKDIDEAKLAGIIEDFLSDVRFDKFNFAWHMGNKSPRVQESFWELLWAFIEEMADSYERGLIQTKHAQVAKMCYELRQWLRGEADDNQLQLEF